MTEQEWLRCADPEPMLEFIHGKASERKLRLFACGCCRRVERLLKADVARKALDAAERYADGRIRDGTAQSWHRRTVAAQCSTGYSMGSIPEFLAYGAVAWSVSVSGKPQAYFAASRGTAEAAATAINRPLKSRAWWRAFRAELSALSALLRDIVGNPFRTPPAIDPGCLQWQGGTVRRMASAIYDGRRFAELPILADALEDAGCDHADILSHCRGGGEHARGCFVVDALLGKT
jgi:hypothetical protein